MGFWGIPISVQAVPTNPIDTDISTVDTIQQMIAIARVSSHSPRVVSVVDALQHSLPNKPSNLDLVRAIFWWIKNHVKFVSDESILGAELGYEDVNQELLIPADTLLAMAQPMGDCDDFSMLVASFMLCISVPVWFVAVAVDRDQPWRFSHVYCRVRVDGVSIPFDASHGKQLGWETKSNVFRRMEWLVS
jgi:hypothetical protein